MKDQFLHKIYKLKIGTVLVGPEHDVVSEIRWGWISRKEQGNVYSMLYNREDGHYIHQYINTNLIDKNTPVAKISEVSNKFLHEIIKYEFEKRGPGFNG